MAFSTLLFILATFILTFDLISATTSSIKSPVDVHVTFDAPEELYLGTNFIAACNVTVQPQSDFVVTYYFNDIPLGEYSISKGGDAWKTVNLLPGINLFNRFLEYLKLKHPIYEVLFEPLTTAALKGAYKCSATVDAPYGGSARYFSNVWDPRDVSGRNSTLPAVSIEYSNEPPVKEIRIGQPFIGKCSLKISPDIVNYNVTFVYDRSVFVWYIVRGDTPQRTVYWQMGSTGSPFVNIFRGNTTYPNYTIQIVPKQDVTINTRFHCFVDVEIPFGGKASYDSKEVCTMMQYCS